jgi:hypothetical protein
MLLAKAGRQGSSCSALPPFQLPPQAAFPMKAVRLPGMENQVSVKLALESVKSVSQAFLPVVK